MPTLTGSVNFGRLYTIDTITASDFLGGSGNPNNTLTLSNLSQVDPSAIDPNAQIDDQNGNGVFNGGDTLTTTFPGDSTTTDLNRVNLSAQFGNPANGFGSGTTYAIFEDASGQQYILFNEDFDISRISGGSVTLTEQGDATGNMATHDIVCFAKGTMILTPSGERRIEDIRVGDALQTFDGQVTRVHWASAMRCTAEDFARKSKLRPIKITAGMIAPGMPNRDLYLSAQHRVLVRSPIAERLCGHQEALIASNKLLSVPGVEVDFLADEVEYYHLLTDRHDVLVANGMPSESLMVGPHLKEALAPGGYEEVQQLVEQGAVSQSSVRPVLSNKDSKKFVQRSIKNDRAVFTFAAKPLKGMAFSGSEKRTLGQAGRNGDIGQVLPGLKATVASKHWLVA